MEQKILFEDENYPGILKKISKPPKALNYIGNVNLLKKPGIAIVGSRNCTEYGKQMAIKFAKELSNYGMNIISGMAIGVDSYAHKGAIENGGCTIAVLPSGLQNVYPEENKEFYNKIINSDGLVISEYDSKVQANYQSFLQRNRIVSGLALGLIVVEGAFRSGTSVTAKITMEEGKKVFCVPSSLNNEKGYSPNHLIRNGGILVTSAEDIIQEYPKLNLKRKKKIVRNVNSKYERIYNLIGDEPIYIDDILSKSKMNFEEANYQLMMLELEGYIISIPGKNYKRRC